MSGGCSRAVTHAEWHLPTPVGRARRGCSGARPRRHGQGANSVAELMPPARPVFLGLAGRPELREIAGGWAHREDIHTAGTDNRPADVILIRADAHIAWACTRWCILRHALARAAADPARQVRVPCDRRGTEAPEPATDRVPTTPTR
ncbi:MULTISPECIES: hypothetical protein [unclassified Streptomyces]|uniref:aromatic-ring hydroxylase C-terminal domain-containing protein n=1 Tax=unclassified Streptomyces TaxID=2593676 RepID=UPI00333AB25D